MNKNPASPSAPFVINGWSIFMHPVFLDQLEGLTEAVEKCKKRDPSTYERKNCTKRLAAIWKLITQDIPAEPNASKFRQGDTLGIKRKHWFRAKFLQQYRLFYRFNMDAKIIVLAWVNDEKTLRAYGSKTDAYATFKTMLSNDRPPDNYDSLLAEAKSASLTQLKKTK